MTAVQALSKDPPARLKTKGNVKAVTTATNPPVVITAPEPHPIFGRALTIPGFTLKNQPVTMLAFWLKRARKIVDEIMAGPPDDDKLTAALAPFNEIYDTILRAETKVASDVALQIASVVDYFDWFKTSEIEEAISAEQFRVIARNIKRATAFIEPRKRVGKLARGQYLTRAGLLFRYQNFLIEEIHTLSFELYGDARYALQWITFDDEVHKRCKRANKCDPFLDPTKLTARATSVLKSLKIDTAKADGRAVNLGKGGAR